MPPRVGRVFADLRVFADRTRDDVDPGTLVNERTEPAGGRVEFQAQGRVLEGEVRGRELAGRSVAPVGSCGGAAATQVVEAISEGGKVNLEGEGAAALVAEDRHGADLLGRHLGALRVDHVHAGRLRARLILQVDRRAHRPGMRVEDDHRLLRRIQGDVDLPGNDVVRPGDDPL